MLDNPNVIYGFQDNNVYITGVTLQELDNHKNDHGEVGYNAREVGRILDELRKRYGHLTDGVPLQNEGTLHLLSPRMNERLLPVWMDNKKPDNRIIEACLWLKERSKDMHTILLSNDTYLRIHADNCGIETESVWNDRVIDSNYTGHRFVDIKDQAVIDILHDKGMIDASYILQTQRRANRLCWQCLDELRTTQHDSIWRLRDH